MALSSGWGFDGVTYDGKEMRQLVEGLAGHNGIAKTPGVTSGLKVAQQTSPTTTVKMAAGTAIINATGSGLFGEFHVANDADLTSPAFTATSANGRKDRLILRDTGGVPALEIVEGVASGSPAEPSITGDNYLELALITLPSSTTNITTAMITDRRVFVGKWAQPWGCLSSVVGTASVAGATPATPTIITTASLTLVANRRIRIDYSTNLAVSSGLTSLQNLELVRDTTVIQSWQHWVTLAARNEPVSFAWIDSAPTAGAHTYLVRWSTAVASTRSDFASSTYKRQLIVTDVGPAANPD